MAEARPGVTWFLLSFVVKAADVDHYSEQLTTLGALSVSLQAANDDNVFQLSPGKNDHWAETEIQAIFESGELLDQALIWLKSNNIAPTLTPGEDKNWVALNQQNFPPQCYGNRLWVCPSWSDSEQLEGTVIHLDPGMAFGTGTHPTTSLCLTWLSQQNLTNKTVVDYGCGSGILAIAAKKLGAKEVMAVDHDPQALSATKDNAEKNQLTISTYLPDQMPTLHADIVIANILSGPLVELAPTLKSFLTDAHSILVLSGLLNHEQTELIEAYRPLHLTHAQIQEEWAMLVFQEK